MSQTNNQNEMDTLKDKAPHIYHAFLGMLAEDNLDYKQAKQEYKQALALAIEKKSAKAMSFRWAMEQCEAAEKVMNQFKSATSKGLGYGVVHKKSTTVYHLYENLVVPPETLKKAKAGLPTTNYQLVKYNYRSKELIFYWAPMFITANEPPITRTVKVDSKFRVYELANSEAKVLLDKWRYVDTSEYKSFDVKEAMKRSVAWRSLKLPREIENKKDVKSIWESEILPCIGRGVFVEKKKG